MYIELSLGTVDVIDFVAETELSPSVQLSGVSLVYSGQEIVLNVFHSLDRCDRCHRAVTVLECCQKSD